MFTFGKEKQLFELCRDIVTHLDDAVVAVDALHNIAFYNAGAERIFGHRADEVLGRHLNMLIPERFHPHHDVMIENFGAEPDRARGAAARTRQIIGLRKDGTEFVTSTSVLKIGAPPKMFYAAVVRDVSENRKTEVELLRLASTDPLTGVLNRREFTVVAEQESLRSQRYGRALSVMMLDLDNFKMLNDTHGHAAGDKALQKFTSLCANALRTTDVFARWGGEEFAALLPETEADAAAIIAERLRKIVEGAAFSYNGKMLSVTVSIGIAQFRAGETGIDGPLSRADKAVYDAKKAGRNRISVYRN